MRGRRTVPPTDASEDKWRRREAIGALIVLAVSFLALALAPSLMPASYSVVTNTTSESAAQGIEGAWLARLGFLTLAFASIWLARLARRSWGLAGSVCFVLFGVSMTAVAAFASRPWQASATYNQTEDLLHTIAATCVGFAFALGVASVAFQHGFSRPPRPFDIIAIAATIALPLGMSLFPSVAGVLQRMMFLVAYAWFGAAGVSIIRRTAGRDEQRTTRSGDSP